MMKELSRLLITLFALSCARTDSNNATRQPAQTSTDKTGSIANAAQKVNSIEAPQGLPINPDDAFLDAEYSIKVKIFGIPLCDGMVKIKVNAALAKKNSTKIIEIPEGILDCRIHTIDLAEIFGAISSRKGNTSIKDALIVENGIIHLSSLGDGRYSPPRPVFPSFLASERSLLAKINKSSILELFDTKEQKRSEGRVGIKVLKVGTPHFLESMRRNFSDTIQFEIQTEGFDGMNRVTNFLFERMSFVMSLDPLVILEIRSSGPASDLASAAGTVGIDIPKDDSGFVDGLIKTVGGLIDVDLTMELTHMQNLDENLRNSSKDTGAPIIGN